MAPAGVDINSFAMLTFNAFSQNALDVDLEETPFLTVTFGENKTSLSLHWKLKQKLGFQVILGSVKLQRKDGDGSKAIDLMQELVRKFNQYQKENMLLSETNLHLRTSVEKLNAEKATLAKEHKEWEDKIFTRVITMKVMSY
jgi:FtsZ-binding cell division protein ZapB